jgi:hypothetical protein
MGDEYAPWNMHKDREEDKRSKIKKIAPDALMRG